MFESSIWGPHFWFFLHTIAHAYPDYPNSVTKRKYYDFIQNIPIFVPEREVGNRFSNMLDKYPVTPYLDNKESFIRWIHFIHNKYNVLLGKEEISFLESMDKYRAEYKPKPVYLSEKYGIRKRDIYLSFIFMVFLAILFLV